MRVLARAYAEHDNCRRAFLLGPVAAARPHVGAAQVRLRFLDDAAQGLAGLALRVHHGEHVLHPRLCTGRQQRHTTLQLGQQGDAVAIQNRVVLVHDQFRE